jgi:predicted ATPase
MKFVVLKKSELLEVGQYPVFVLIPDPWDDFGYRTTFQLIYEKARGNIELIGSLKIITTQLRSGRTPMPDDVFMRLNNDYASLGADLDFYETLLRVMKRRTKYVLRALRDVATDPRRLASFKDLPTFTNSLLRFTPAQKALKEADGIIAQSPPRRKPTEHPLFSFRTRAGGGPLMVKFDFNGPSELPGRVIALIGPNGAGKTRLLANLALAAFDDRDDQERLDWGKLKGNDWLFNRVLTFSYSAFDDFDVPGESMAQKKSFLRNNSGFGYRYCGLRSLKDAKIEERTALDRRRPEDLRQIGSAPQSISAPLKTDRQIAQDFSRALGLAVLTPRRRFFLDAVGIILEEASFEALGEYALHALLDEGETSEDTLTGIKTLFRRLSTGHKFALLTVTQLAAYLRNDSLLLFDEPEANLHPPLVAALLRSVRSLLDARRSYAIITTHSPLVVQETLSLHVRYMSRDANGTSISTPSTETFGEDLGAITRDVFGITSRSSDFTSVLRNLARHHGLAAIEALFPNGLSVQARSIVHAVQSRRRAG